MAPASLAKAGGGSGGGSGNSGQVFKVRPQDSCSVMLLAPRTTARRCKRALRKARDRQPFTRKRSPDAWCCAGAARGRLMQLAARGAGAAARAPAPAGGRQRRPPYPRAPQERVSFNPHPKTLTMAGDYEYFAAQGHHPLAFALAELVDNALRATKGNSCAPGALSLAIACCLPGSAGPKCPAAPALASASCVWRRGARHGSACSQDSLVRPAGPPRAGGGHVPSWCRWWWTMAGTMA